MSNRLFRLGLGLSVLLVVLSWIASVMGADVSNVMSAEGLRWSLMHGIQGGAMFYLPHAICVSMLIALIGQIRNVFSDSGHFWDIVLGKPQKFILFFCFLLSVFLASLPGGPLRGVGGGLYPSPLSHAAFPLFVLLSLTLLLPLTKESIVGSLRKALCDSADVIILFPIFAFLWNLIRYVWM